ncbi:MAG: hypothetical protein QE280_14245 [Caulobacter sp.]|nr:hypothetical protein [Caulobacter sp.]
MNKTLASFAAFAVLATALPAGAQPYGGHAPGGYRPGGDYYGPGQGGPYGGGYRDQAGPDRPPIPARQARLREWIARAQYSGDLRPWEAQRMRETLWSIRRIESRYFYDGRISRWEAADLHSRLDRLAWQVRTAARDDGPRYGHGFGQGGGPR